MEKDLAILIADLSGYTALTETHGALSAADLIEGFIEIVERSLVGNSRVCERKGDEVMITADSADMLLGTAYSILQHSTGKVNFLQVHGALHWGKILERNNHYFGHTINVTARIASKARAGTFWCSDQFINQVSKNLPFVLTPCGKHTFKNVSAEAELHELSVGGNDTFWIDPVCRMIIADKEGSIPHPDSPSIFFCSEDCRKIYMEQERNQQSIQ